MTTLQQIKRLLRISKDAIREVDKLQNECKHKRVWIKEGPDAYCGWGVSSICADCGKGMGCRTMTPGPDEKLKAGKRMEKR